MNKQAELTRWTPKRLLSLLMALIMTLSLLPTAAFADDNPNEWYLDNFKTTGNEPESQVIVASGFFAGDARYELRINIDPNKTYMPGDRVSVNAIAQLFNVDSVNQPLQIAISEQTLTANNTDSTLTVSYPFVGNSAIIVGKDGSISFNAGITYDVTVDGTTFADTKNVTVKIKNLWTGYNVTYTQVAGETFTGVPAGNNAKTVAKNANNSDYTQEYTIPDGAKASKYGYTFKGWDLYRSDSSLGTLTQPGTTITSIDSNIRLAAHLEQNHEIRFNPVYSGVSGLPYDYKDMSQGQTYTIPYTPELSGYDFKGWTVTGATLDADGVSVKDITSQITITPIWEKSDGSTPVGSHKVTFLAGAADAYIPFVATATVANGTDYTIPTDKPTREGYEFKGWNDGTNTYQAGATISGVTKDIVLSAMWQQEMVTVTFPAADHLPAGVSYVATPASTPVAKGSNVTFRLKLAEGYDPATLHVFADGVALLGTPVNSYDVYYEYTVHNVMADTIIHVGPVTEKTFNVTLPTGAGFDAAFVVPAGTVPAGAADNKLTTVNYDGTVSFTVKARPGYTVEGVYANGVKLDPDTSTTDTYTIKNIKSNQAVMVDMAAVQFHTVTYVLDGAQMATQSVANGSNATSLSAPDKTGYNWDSKWYKDERYTTEFDFNTLITKDTILYGRYAPIDVTISYDVLPGVTTTKTYGLAATLTETIPTKDGCTFLGWSESDGATAASYLPGATFSKEIENPITLYAVWQKNTYTITFSSGEGYSLHSTGSMTVAHGDPFVFNLFVDPAYAQNTPTVYVNTGSINAANPTLISTSDAPTHDGAKVYQYKLERVTANTAINAEVTKNKTYTVTFMTNGTIYQTQQVEFNHKATQPVDPKVEGYTFGGWYKDTGWADADKWDFATPITGDTTIYAKLDPITPKITWPTATTGYTIAVTGTAPDGTILSPANGDTVPYKSVVTFTIKILDGYDASKMQVGINGVLLAPKSIVDNVYTFEFTAKENTNISVTGVERKTVTIIYNANARDDVSGMPEAQTVKYYLDTTPADNDTIIKQTPVRTGYEFLGWSTDSKKDAADTGYDAATIESPAGATAKFTANTTLYAVWKAQSTNVTLAITDVAYAPTTGRVIQYEGKSITLQASLNVGAKGTIEFYKAATSGAAGTKIGSTTVNGESAELSVKVGEYKTIAKDEYYYAIFKSEADEGYADSAKSNEMNVGIFSKAICWVIGDTAASELLVYKGNGATGTPITDAMIAGQTYTLKVKTDMITGVETLDSKKPVLGQDYKIVWQYYEVDKNDWKTVSESSDKATYLVTGEYSGYQFRAQIVPLGENHDSLYLKAAKYDDTGLLNDKYDVCLYTKPTAATTRQTTTTTLTVTGADNEENDVYINGTQPFNATAGSHLAQFEGQKVTLTATVKDTTTGTPAVTTGHVNFYRKGATADTLLNASPIAVGTNGVATCEVEISKWTGGNVTENKDEFYAVYLANATYDTSASWTAAAAGSTATGELKAVYIKSTAIQTPIIDSTLPGKLNGADANSTSYEYDLTGLLAGVQHTFTLRQTGAAATADNQFSVVAKDGRTVDANNYTVEWLKTTGSNEQKLDVAENIKIVNVDDNKVGDKYRIKLIPQNDMKVGEVSNYAIIGKKQDVTVAVEASDEIKSTAETDVYQLNKITLTATVAAKETSSTMKPTGTVTFYYKDGSNWVKLDSATLAEDTNHKMTASITTKKLPVDKTNNTKQDVEITAVYEGNETFAVSGNYNETSKEVSAGSPANGVTDKTVTVYSSVVYVDSAENTTNTPGTHGIAITTEDGKVLANETNVNLKLSDVYTLDHATDAADKALLAYGTDYTVQWQMLTNAAAYPDKAKENTPWENITSATGTTCQIDVVQGAAYRAVITVNDTPIAKGSYDEVHQAIPGRKVYYSNILVAANAPATLTVNVNTSNTSKGYEGIVEGETVTIHTFTSGATGTTPISKLTVNIYEGKSPAAGATPVFTAEKANVNGHVSFDWNKDVTPGYYTLKVKATFTNGYDDKEITRTLIVRDNDYSFNVTGDNAVYNGKVQGLKVTVADMGIEDALAQKSVVVYYYTDEARTQQVEPTQAGTYYATVRLQESAYWTEKTIYPTFTIKPREVSVVDLVAQAKVYDGTNNANIQEIILNDAEVNSTTGLPTDDKGIIDGDSVYAVGTGNTSQAAAGTADLGVKNVTLMGDDAANYDLTSYSHTEKFNIQRSQVKGAIVSGRTYKYTGKDIKLAASDIYLIDQAGSQLTDYDVTYYYHNGDGVEQVSAMNKMGKYTVIARPKQDNYKGGATETVYVGTADNAGTLVTNAVSSLITISNTVKVYDGQATGVTATATKGTASASYYYDGAWKDNAPTAAGRYLVKATVTNGSVTDTAYGIYTIVKARPEFTPTTDKPSMEYTSGRYDGAIGAGFGGKSDSTAETYITYTGGTIQGVAYEAPTEVGKYIATVHVGETANYTAHEKQVAFEITPKALTITADDISRQQYGAYPDLTASFKGLATGVVAADTSLRDVQIQPELIDDSNYTNDASDQVGNNYSITAVAALARNYDVSYVKGNMSVTREDPKPHLNIRGMIKNGDNATDLAYYGDVIQLYAYGNQSEAGVYNTSSILAWSVGVGDPATITQDGLLTVKGVGTVTVTLTRGIGAQQISTTLTFEAKKQEVKVVVPDQDLIYNGAEQKYDGGKFYAENAKGERITATPYMHDGKVKRTNVGSQIITSWVGDTNATYQSEHYCGLFTINVKDVTIKPTAADTIYGTRATGLTFTKETPAGSDKVLADDKTVSVADAYGNLDVYDGYEILVAGKEDSNYNVHYQTKNDREVVGDVNVKELALTIKTGTLLNEQAGMTSGSLNPNGKYPVNGAEVNSAIAMDPSNVRMYGEPNWVMDKDPVTLISGDTLADLTNLGDKLVSFNYNIGADANVRYTDKSTKLTVSGSAMSDYEVLTDASKMAFKNYNETYTLGTQNIYQRPVELKLRDSMTQLNAYKPTIMPGGTVDEIVLKELIINNLIVTQHNNEGGLAELLKHTIKDLDIQISYTLSGDTITVTVTIGNQNYYLANGPVTVIVKVDPTKIVAKYGPLGWTSASVTMVGVDESGHETGPVDVSGKVLYKIYVKDPSITNPKYSDYKGKTPVLNREMFKGSSTGVYIVNYDRLPAGEYVMFAIAEGYTIIE